jgi:hypothetical protein
MAEFLRGVAGFNWDKGNTGKNESKHGVTDRESEEIFFNRPLVIARSAKGESEIRFAALGETYGSRLLTVVFTLRGFGTRMTPRIISILPKPIVWRSSLILVWKRR